MKFVIPFKTPSVNHLYFNYNNRRILTKEARELKKEIIKIVELENNDLIIGGKLSINIKIHEDWYCKNGTIKRKDISNREKFLVDSIFEDLELDDRQIFIHNMQKIQDKEEYTEVEILNI